jgi:integrase
MAKTKKYGAGWTVEGAGWIYRRPTFESGKWRVRRRHLASGRMQRLKLDAQNLSDAKDEVKARAEKERREAEEGGPAAKARASTVGAALDEWYAFLEKTQGFRGPTIRDYKGVVGHYKEALGEEKVLSEVEYADVEKLMTGRWADRAARTKCGHLDKLGAFFEWAKRRGYTRLNPAKDFERPKAWQRERLQATKETGQALVLSEMRALLAACRGSFLVDFRPDIRAEGEVVAREKLTEMKPPAHLFTFVFLALRTALRVSNLIGSRYKPPLCWRNLDLEQGIMSLPGEVMKNGEPLRVPLHLEAVEFLKKLRGARVPDPNEPVVGPITELKNSFASALVRAKLSDPATKNFLGELRNVEKPHVFRIHDLRHSALSLLGANVPSYVSEELAGHTASTQNAKYGRHISIEDLRTWLDKLPPLLSEGKSAKKGKFKALDGAGTGR